MKDAVKALIRDDQGRILVLFRSETHPHLAHDIDLPGGEIDENESVEATLMRETQEEIGLSVIINSRQQIHSWIEFWGTQQYLYDVKAGPVDNIKLSWEHESYSWMTEEEFVNYPAKDEFMHKAQAWLRDGIDSVEIPDSVASAQLANA